MKYIDTNPFWYWIRKMPLPPPPPPPKKKRKKNEKNKKNWNQLANIRAAYDHMKLANSILHKTGLKYCVAGNAYTGSPLNEFCVILAYNFGAKGIKPTRIAQRHLTVWYLMLVHFHIYRRSLSSRWLCQPNADALKQVATLSSSLCFTLNLHLYNCNLHLI